MCLLFVESPSHGWRALLQRDFVYYLLEGGPRCGEGLSWLWKGVQLPTLSGLFAGEIILSSARRCVSP